MKDKKKIIILSVVAIIIIILAIILLYKNKELANNKIKIIDATYHSPIEKDSCSILPEKIYEDKDHIYYLTCAKSESVFVKYPDNTKIQVTKALADEKVTIDELIKAGLNIKIEDK